MKVNSGKVVVGVIIVFVALLSFVSVKIRLNTDEKRNERRAAEVVQEAQAPEADHSSKP